MDKDFLYIAISSIISLSTLLAVLLLYIQNKKLKNNELIKTSAELSYMRSYFEKKIIDINSKLLADSERWNEVNHLLLSYNPKVDESFFQSKPAFNDSFFNNFRIKPENINVKEDQVFLLTPFIKSEKVTFFDVEAICHQLGFKCLKGDEEYITGDIFAYILNKILESRIVIANINGRNPNVFYELGIAQAIGKPTLLISKNIENIPFDVKSQNIIIYKDSNELSDKLSLMLSSILVNE
ncbi:hypothetical protein DF185_15850 [Marinifilum breve]|uniref:Nucleoside 2-deoxyribosyltransferase n=1 Tax=Marinifilum breve TaxID=2184082 RepID=A0A2V3ZYL1_9BACT|nr:hypothetical protein [Marinifilum breve]PXX98848.1 hypothetical protein DF185_15850 [Marinifilum breve]